MTGNDVSEKELEFARKFLRVVAKEQIPPDDQMVSIRFERLVRVVAWYGAIRGGEQPGTLVVNGEDFS